MYCSFRIITTSLFYSYSLDNHYDLTYTVFVAFLNKQNDMNVKPMICCY